ncbi:MAG: MATE family efflux transporter [Myxococcota bacterium]
MSESSVTFYRVVQLALPAAAASAATPLLGLIDAWALGRSADPLQVGAVGLAAAIFSALYWTSGFLRISAAALVARAAGAGDEPQTRAILVRTLGLGALFGLILLAARPLLEPAAFTLLRTGSAASEETFVAAQEYFRIRLWAAPAALAAYAATGWLTGRGRTAVVMFATLAMTILNAALDWYFVAIKNQGAAGVAKGTQIAEIVGLFLMGLGILFVLSRDGLGRHWHRAFHLDRADMIELFTMNRDIFIRTFLLVAVFAFFTQQSSGWGDVTLAANQILVQLLLLTGLALDGPAIAAESLVGRAVARSDRANYRRIFRYAAYASALAAAPFALAYGVFQSSIVDFMTTDPAIKEATRTFIPWVALSPIVVAVCFLLDGIFIGAGRSQQMRDGMIVSIFVYLIAWYGLTAAFGAHGHWAAFLVFFAVRGGTLVAWLPRVEALFDSPSPSR